MKCIRGLFSKYPLRVWLFIIFAAPFSGIWLNAIRIQQYDNFGSLLGLPLALFLAALFVTMPWFVMFSFLYRFLYRRRFPVVPSKIFLSFFSACCVYLTFYVIGGEEMLRLSNRDGFLLITSYAVFAILGPIIFPYTSKSVTEKYFSF
jgi:hypothetical protein